MAKRKVSDTQVKRAFKKTKSVSETARRLGVTKGTISKRLKSLKIKTSREIQLESAGEIVVKEINAFEQISKINQYANELLDILMCWNRGDPEAIRVLESQARKIAAGDKEHIVKEFKFKDPRELAIKLMAEIRGQLRLQLEIMQSLFDMKAAAEFQQELIQLLGEIDPNVRIEFIRRLQERRAIRRSVQLN